MTSEWNLDVVSQPSSDAVVTYTAVVSLSLERSSISFADGVPREALAEALARPPAWTLDPWSPPRGGTDRDLTSIALSKMKAVLDFRAGLEANSASEIRAALQDRFPAVASGSRNIGSTGERFKSFVVEAAVYANGEADWGFITPAAGIDPSGMRSDDADGDLRIFLQNTVRADIVERLAALR